jgi:hypothetical protein
MIAMANTRTSSSRTSPGLRFMRDIYGTRPPDPLPWHESPYILQGLLNLPSTAPKRSFSHRQHVPQKLTPASSAPRRRTSTAPWPTGGPPQGTSPQSDRHHRGTREDKGGHTDSLSRTENHGPTGSGRPTRPRGDETGQTSIEPVPGEFRPNEPPGSGTFRAVRTRSQSGLRTVTVCNPLRLP